MTEPRDIRIKRLRMRSMRRGTKEMDMILIRYSDARLDALSAAELDLYDAFLAENDQDLYQWVSGQIAPPAQYDELVREIQAEVGAGQ